MSQGMQAGFEHKTGVPRYGALIAVLWTLLLAYSVFWVQNAHKREALLLKVVLSTIEITCIIVGHLGLVAYMCQ